MKISQKISETLSIPTIKNVDAPFSTGQESWIILKYAGVDPALCFYLFLESKIKELYPSIPPHFKLKLDTHTQKKGGRRPLDPPLNLRLRVWSCVERLGDRFLSTEGELIN